jgi:mono/diheme cytochrome c family protein
MVKKNQNYWNAGSSEKHNRIGYFSLLASLLLFAWVTLAFAQEPAKKDLGLFYQQNCVRCHGADGSAVGLDGKKLKGKDLTDEKWLKRANDDKMIRTILKGKFFGVAMPGYKDDLSKEEARRMVTTIIRKSKKGKVIGPETGKPGEE